MYLPSSIREKRALALLVVLTVGSAYAAAQLAVESKPGVPSFSSLSGTEVTLTRYSVPLVKAAGKKVSVQCEDPALAKAIEAKLLLGDPTLVLDSSAPDFAIICRAKAGELPEITSLRKGSSTTEEVIGDMQVQYLIVRTADKMPLATRVASAKVEEPVRSPFSGRSYGIVSFGHKAISTSSPTAEAEQKLVASVAQKIAGNLVKTDESIEVPLATGGTLTPVNKLAEGRLWSEYAKALEQLQPSSEKSSDAYRIYNLGVANEALAYQSADSLQQRKYLENAFTDYTKALAASPSERHFVAAHDRVQALIKEGAADPRTNLWVPNGAVGERKDSLAGNLNQMEMLTNQLVLKMTKADVAEGTILDAVKSAPDVSFDLSAQGQMELIRGGVKEEVLLAMEDRAKSEPENCPTPTSQPVPGREGGTPGEAPAKRCKPMIPGNQPQ